MSRRTALLLTSAAPGRSSRVPSSAPFARWQRCAWRVLLASRRRSGESARRQGRLQPLRAPFVSAVSQMLLTGLPPNPRTRPMHMRILQIG